MSNANAMDTTQQTSGPPSLAATSPHSTGTNGSTSGAAQQQQQTAHQQAAQPQATQQQGGQQQSIQQQAAIADFFRRFEAEAQTLGVLLPFTQQFVPQVPTGATGGVGAGITGGIGGAGGAGGIGGWVPNNTQATFNAFSLNCPPPQGNFWGSHGATYTTQSSTMSHRSHFERVTGDIPVEKFPYGTQDADWSQWSDRFETAVKVATNASGQDRLNELCLMWIPLKLKDDAQPIYDKCAHKNRNWPLLKVELAEALEDPMIRRKWARYMDAYKKPPSLSLQVYRANIIGFVNRYSPALVNDPVAYNMELYNRFVNGLEVDRKEFIEESIPYKKESLDNAYSYALKYEAKLAKKAGDRSAAAMTHAGKDTVARMRQDLEKVKTQLAASEVQETSSSSASSGNESDSDSDGYENDLGAAQKEENNDDCKERWIKSTSAALTQALCNSMKELHLKPKMSRKGHHSKKN